ncbi:GNAT family N-acetyltransferase [Curtobacterium flaccumfaciens]|uniref:GNAT family N-acetyltransferase n=1 Tax=Curtobacterium flaccumfaciens TaxID=2035 RepID=UPI0026592C27|nr:GNAT family N-acetyltransferase [Curtobacterium flaccumfaciens]MCS5520881.1 GNAT family N-acetyltransferase [Curtobacterium flaccumfaciens]
MTDEPLLEIRSASETDAASVAAVVVRAYANEQGWVSDAELVTGERTSPDQVRAMIRARSVVLVAVHDATIVATCHLRASDRATAHLGMLAVDPAWQSRGISRRLRTAAIAYAEEAMACESVELEVLSVHEGLRRVYERSGFIATGETRPFPAHVARVAGLHFVVLRRSLGASGQTPDV